ncbi:MAG: GNAT family N-acetyltransferase [Candidatus Woesearchaeota archaeon]|nr:GNAT family N-acetyltransferase [Candidatus Woesearchaeota archaeon]
MNGEGAVILDFLMRIGSKREVIKYLATFSEIDPHKFAIIKVSGSCIEQYSKPLCDDLYTLNTLGLYPTVIFGWGNKVTCEMEKRGLESRFHTDGNRITTPDTLNVIKDVVKEFTGILVEGMREADRDSSFHGHGNCVQDLTRIPIFYGRRTENSDLGLVGEIERVDTGPILDAIKSERIPILVPLCYDDESNQILNVNADTAARMLFRALDPVKYISLTETGGICDAQNHLIAEINLRNDLERILSSGCVTGGMLKKLKEAEYLLKGLLPEKSVQITSPKQLLYELFTNRGAGTIIKQGYDILTYASSDGLDTDKMKEVMESALKKHLLDDFFTNPRFKPDKVILESGYKGGMFIQRRDDAWYIDKIFVAPKSQNNGLSAELFQELFKQAEKAGITRLFWRAKTTNEFNDSYTKTIWSKNDSNSLIIPDGEFIYYFIGIPVEEVQKYKQIAKTKPYSFKEDYEALIVS